MRSRRPEPYGDGRFAAGPHVIPTRLLRARSCSLRDVTLGLFFNQSALAVSVDPTPRGLSITGGGPAGTTASYGRRAWHRSVVRRRAPRAVLQACCVLGPVMRQPREAASTGFLCRSATPPSMPAGDHALFASAWRGADNSRDGGGWRGSEFSTAAVAPFGAACRCFPGWFAASAARRGAAAGFSFRCRRCGTQLGGCWLVGFGAGTLECESYCTTGCWRPGRLFTLRGLRPPTPCCHRRGDALLGCAIEAGGR